LSSIMASFTTPYGVYSDDKTRLYSVYSACEELEVGGGCCASYLFGVFNPYLVVYLEMSLLLLSRTFFRGLSIVTRWSFDCWWWITG
jgi:membrane-anchored protein YejM (alkaline phosphatase superfamily)